ncbi:MAG: hypothetical protein WCW35_00345 [Bacteroidota bacterium]
MLKIRNEMIINNIETIIPSATKNDEFVLKNESDSMLNDERRIGVIEIIPTRNE